MKLDTPIARAFPAFTDRFKAARCLVGIHQRVRPMQKQQVDIVRAQILRATVDRSHDMRRASIVVLQPVRRPLRRLQHDVAFGDQFDADRACPSSAARPRRMPPPPDNCRRCRHGRSWSARDQLQPRSGVRCPARPGAAADRAAATRRTPAARATPPRLSMQFSAHKSYPASRRKRGRHRVPACLATPDDCHTGPLSVSQSDSLPLLRPRASQVCRCCEVP